MNWDKGEANDTENNSDKKKKMVKKTMFPLLVS